MKTRIDPVGNSSRHGKSNGAAERALKSDELDSSSANTDCPIEEMIAVAAYFRAEQRGFTPGNEMSDWLEAKTEVEESLGKRRE